MVKVSTGDVTPVALARGSTLSGGDLVSVLVSGNTGEHFAVVETRAGRGRGSARHVHHHEDELVYVLEGTVRFHI